MRRAAYLLILSGLLLLQPGVAAPAGLDDTNGAYRLIFKGCYTGTGNGVVTPKSVMIRGDLVDENGNRVDFVADKLAMENHRFHDQVNVGGRTIVISGRVDPSGATLRKARLSCTFTAVGLGFGRVAGEHN
jgi:hypothetical protein